MSLTRNNRIPNFKLALFCWLEHAECSSAYYCEGLSKHAHFRNFGMAFLTLFRVATGDNWNGIMKVWNLEFSFNVIAVLRTVLCALSRTRDLCWAFK